MTYRAWGITLVLAILGIGWLVYQNTGDRKLMAEIEGAIEDCGHISECRVVEDGGVNDIRCWVVDGNNQIQVWDLYRNDLDGEVEAICENS